MSDLQQRLDFVEKKAEEIRNQQQQSALADGSVADLAYLVSYLARIVRKHLETGEV